MNRDEKLVAAWFVDRSHAVRHMRNGEDPPDLVVDGDIAVEITTILSHANQSWWDFIDGICKSLGPAEGERAYWINFEVDDEALLQNKDTGKATAIKRDIKTPAKVALRNHYANPDTAARGPERQMGSLLGEIHIQLPHGVRLGVMGRINNNQDHNPNNAKYRIASGGDPCGALVVGDLIRTIQSAINKKTANRIVQERAGKYREWWLVITDPLHQETRLDDDEFRSLIDTIDHGAPWRRVLLANVAQGKVSSVVDLTGGGRRSPM